MRLKKILFYALFLLLNGVLFAQSELVPLRSNIYDFLKRMQVKGIIKEYNSALLPIDLRSANEWLSKINQHKEELSRVDNKILQEMLTEFNLNYSLRDSLTYSLINSPSIIDLFDNSRQKYLYSYRDENVSFFADGIASLSYRSFKGDSYNNSILLGEIGLRFRGTLFENTGYYLRVSNGQQLSGGESDRIVSASFDPRLSSNVKFLNEKYFDSFEGYLRYTAAGNWFALTIGREAMVYGFGYADKLFLSTNTVPYDFIRLDLNYKSISYSFSYGNVKGDSLGRVIDSKNVVNNTLNFNFGRVKLGFFETVIIADRGLSFTYLNPVSFLVSADFTAQNKNNDNTMMGFNFEILPFNNFALQGSLLIDDLDFKTLFKEKSMRDNKFGFQGGIIMNELLAIPDLKLTAEYTRINPYVYTHRTNKASYTHWNLSLGHHLPPNSDEIIVMLDYNFSQRIKLNGSFAYQRSADGYTVNSKGEITSNNGGDLLRGDGDLLAIPEFLKGDRYDKKTFSANLYIEPIKQCYVSLHYSRIIRKLYYAGKTSGDDLFYLTLSFDY
jgi:hypothetical protein